MGTRGWGKRGWGKIGIGGKRELVVVVGRYSIFCKETPHKGLVLYLYPSTRLAILSQNICAKWHIAFEPPSLRPKTHMSSLPVDATTIGCTTLTLLGGYATFVSSKPVSVSSILMIMVLSASTTQAIIGFFRLSNQSGDSDPPLPNRDTDVLDMLGTLASYARFTP